MFAVKYIRPRNSLAAQLALIKVEKSKDERIEQLASIVLFELTMDEIDNQAIEDRLQRRGSGGPTHTSSGSHTDPQSKLVNQRLSN